MINNFENYKKLKDKLNEWETDYIIDDYDDSNNSFMIINRKNKNKIYRYCILEQKFYSFYEYVIDKIILDTMKFINHWSWNHE